MSSKDIAEKLAAAMVPGISPEERESRLRRVRSECLFAVEVSGNLIKQEGGYL